MDFRFISSLSATRFSCMSEVFGLTLIHVLTLTKVLRLGTYSTICLIHDLTTRLQFKTWNFYFVNSTNILRAPNAITGRSKIHWCTLKHCTAWHFFKLLTLAFLLTKTSKLDLITFINIITVMLFMKYLHNTAKIVFLPKVNTKFVTCLPVKIYQNTTNLEATLHKILRLS